TFSLNNQTLDISGDSDPRARFHKAAQELIAFAFPRLGNLKGSYSEATLSQVINNQDSLWDGGEQDLPEAEQEILTEIQRKQNNRERVSAEELVNKFTRRPYGWYSMATLTLIARLYRMRKVELSVSGEPLERQAALEALNNSRKRGGLDVSVQQKIDS